MPYSKSTNTAPIIIAGTGNDRASQIGDIEPVETPASGTFTSFNRQS